MPGDRLGTDCGASVHAERALRPQALRARLTRAVAHAGSSRVRRSCKNTWPCARLRRSTHSSRLRVTKAPMSSLARVAMELERCLSYLGHAICESRWMSLRADTSRKREIEGQKESQRREGEKERERQRLLNRQRGCHRKRDREKDSERLRTGARWRLVAVCQHTHNVHVDNPQLYQPMNICDSSTDACGKVCACI